MNTVRSPALRRALESHWSTSPVIWAVALPLQVVGTLLRNNGFYPNRAGMLLLTVLVGESIVLAMLLFAGSQRRPGRPLHSMTWALVLLLWTTCGIVLSLVLHAGINLVVDTVGVAGIGLGQRLLYVTGTTVLCYLGLTYVADGLMRSRMEVTRLRRANERLIELEYQSQTIAESQKRLLAEILNEQVIPDLQHLAEEAEALVVVAPTHELEALQSRVAYYSETIVRSLSRDITEVVPPRTTEANDGDAVRGFGIPAMLLMVLESPVRLIPTALFLSLMVVQQMVPSCPPRAWLMWLSVIVALAIGSLVAWIWASSGRSQDSPAARILGIGGTVLQYLLLIAAVAWATQTSRIMCKWEGGVPEFALSALVGVCAVAALSVALELRRRSAAYAVILESRIREGERIDADLNDAGKRIRDQVALVLHGSVQGRLTAVSLAIRAYVEAVGGGGSPDRSELLQRVTELLERALGDVHAIFGEEQATLTLEAQLQALQRQWAGLIDVAWGMTPRAAELLGADPELAGWACEIAGEAVTNASRHGRAGSAWIRLDVDRETGTRLVITAIDDGIGPPSGLRAGLGAQRVQSRGGSWTLAARPADGGSVMTVILPAGRVVCEKTDTAAGIDA